MWRVGLYAETASLSMSLLSLNARSCVSCMNELTKINKRFCPYFSVVALLHVARKMSKNGFNEKLMDMLTRVLGCDTNECYIMLSRCKTIVVINVYKRFLFFDKKRVY